MDGFTLSVHLGNPGFSFYAQGIGSRRAKFTAIPSILYWTREFHGPYGSGFTHSLLTRNLPGNADALADLLRRQGHSVILREFRLSPLARGLSNFSLGIGADLLVGSLIQGISDQYYYDLWFTNPGLASQRAFAAAGENATYGVVGTAGAGVIYVIAGALGAGTPPGWVLIGSSILIATGAELFDSYNGQHIHNFWFDGIDDDTLK